MKLINIKLTNFKGIKSLEISASCTDCAFCQVDDTWNIRFCTENGFRLIDDGTEEAEPCDSFMTKEG